MMNKLLFITFLAIFPGFGMAQKQIFSLDDCINYALENSTAIDRAENSTDAHNAYLEQSKAARFPDLYLNASQNFSSGYSYSDTESTWSSSGNSSFGASLSSQLSLYNGARLKNTIRKNEIDLNTSQLDVQTEKELISLEVLSYYIEVLLEKDNVNNASLQLEATREQLSYAEARKEAGTIALSDLLYIQSQLAANKSSLVQAESSHQIALVTLMQLMNMPVSSDFDIEEVPVDELISVGVETKAQRVYNVALGLQPSIKSAELNIESSETDILIAKSEVLPELVLDAGLSTGYNSGYYNTVFGEQVANKLSPMVGLSLSIPVFQHKTAKTNIKIAKIEAENSRLDLVDQQNTLRKYIEQACTDAVLAKSNYEALKEQLAADQESYQVASEMFKQGMLNSVDFLNSKNNLIVSENEFTQAKYTLLLQNEILEYYMGNTIALKN